MHNECNKIIIYSKRNRLRQKNNCLLILHTDEPIPQRSTAECPDEEEGAGEELDPGEGPSGVAEDHPRPRARQRRSRRLANVVQPEDHPILEIQQAGFRMLDRELGGIRRGLLAINTRLARSVAAQERSAAALERIASLGSPAAQPPPGTPLAAPPPPPPTRSPPNTRAARQHPPPSRPSRGQPVRRGPRLRGRGGKKV